MHIRVQKVRIFRRGVFPTEKSVSKIQHSTYNRLKRVENNFKDAPWTISKLEWFKNNFNDGNLFLLFLFLFFDILLSWYLFTEFVCFFLAAIKAYTYLASLDWVPSARQCPSCSAPMVLNKRDCLTDGLTWQCNKKRSVNKKKAKPCGTRVSIRNGTWASKAHLSFCEILQFTLLWYQK